MDGGWADGGWVDGGVAGAAAGPAVGCRGSDAVPPGGPAPPPEADSARAGAASLGPARPAELSVGGTGRPRSGPSELSVGGTGRPRSGPAAPRAAAAFCGDGRLAAGRSDLDSTVPGSGPASWAAGRGLVEADRAGAAAPTALVLPAANAAPGADGAPVIAAPEASDAPPPETVAPPRSPAMSIRRSMRSSRCSNAASPADAPGNSIRAQSSSNTSRGDVVPRMSTSPVCITSAIRVSVAMPSRSAWRPSRPAGPPGASIRPLAAASGTALMITRSRSRCSRSAANRRGSCPASTTRSTAPNTDGAVTGGERVDDFVDQRRVGDAEQGDRAAIGHTLRAGAGQQLVEHATASRAAEPPPARMTSGSTAGSTTAPSSAHNRSSNPRRVVGGISRNG